MEPNGLSTGGIVGLIRILQNYTHMSFSIMYYVAAAIVLIILFFSLGFKSMRRAILVSAVYPTVTLLVEHLDITLLEEKDLILASIFCGILQGIGIGIVAWRGYMFPGTDGLAKAIRKNLLPHIPQSSIMSVLDLSTIIASIFVFDRNIALYAIVTQILITRSMNLVMYGMSPTLVQLEIITTKKDEIVEYIFSELHRGVTVTQVTGEYTQKQYSELRLLCSAREVTKFRSKLSEIDPNAFVTLHEINSVWGVGDGFQKITGTES